MRSLDSANFKQDLESLAEEVWYGEHTLKYVLIPFSYLFQLIVLIRRIAYSAGVLPTRRVSVPVIIIGNLTAGGTGKTPLTIWLAKHLKDKGHTPGIISRGYGGSSSKTPQQVRTDSNPEQVGDEPIIISKNTGLPVAVCQNRYLAAEALIKHHSVDVIISDDGLQHFGLARDLEIVVIDGARRFGNGYCLPAGPLREPKSVLNHIELLVSNGKAQRGEHPMEFEAGKLHKVNEPHVTIDIAQLNGQTVNAVAGIGNPKRFFTLLSNLGMQVNRFPNPDHYHYQQGDLDFSDQLPVVMTEKDAVKCLEIAHDNCWYLPIKAKMNDAFVMRLDKTLRGIGLG